MMTSGFVMFLACWVLIGWATAVVLITWDYNDGESITLEDILTGIVVGGVAGIILLVYLLTQAYNRYHLSFGLKEILTKPIWQKKIKKDEEKD